MVFLPVLCMVDASWAALRQSGPATSRVGVNSAAVSAAARRSPTVTANTSSLRVSSSSSSSSTTTTSTSTGLEDAECIDNYTECIKGSDACGTSFEECINNTLFYAKKPQCNSVLLKCSSSAIATLFGTSSTDSLATKDSNGEYVYPSPSSVLGQFVEASAISNRLDTTNCVKKYTNCLKKDSVCGENFEMCTDNNEFKKQKIFCEPTLARCQADGLKELLGSTSPSAVPSSSSRIGVAIAEGANLAAANAVNTCYKVADQCFIKACEQNPFKCTVDADVLKSKIADVIGGQSVATTKKSLTESIEEDTVQKSQVTKYLKGACMDQIGSNKFCYATIMEQMPKASDLLDEDNRAEVFSGVYDRRMNNSTTSVRIEEITAKFDKKTKDKCYATLSDCAMHACGNGVGAKCYVGVTKSAGRSVNSGAPYNAIRKSCEGLINTDANCLYAASQDATYKYSDADAFDILFPKWEEGYKDPIGVIGKLNASLFGSYSDQKINEMAKRCENTTKSCIKSMCGKDYVNCYRHRNDILSDTYDTDSDKFNNSMNKVGGVLDFNIITGLCMETVKTATSCEDHFAIETERQVAEGDENTSFWGGADAAKSVRDSWATAVSGGYGQGDNFKLTTSTIETGFCVVSDEDLKNNEACQGKEGVSAECDSIDNDGCLFGKKEELPFEEYTLKMNANTMFRRILADLEKEAQAKYNAKITKEQSMCISQNQGGVMGKNDMEGSTYQWVKLKSARVPKNYTVNGLKPNDFAISNDLYGSFCRARVTVQSDDPNVQAVLRKGTDWSTAYFAVGDTFTCGAWIDQNKLDAIAEAAAEKETGTNADGKMNRAQRWKVAGMSILGATVGVAGAEGVQAVLGKKGKGKNNDALTKLEANLSDLNDKLNTLGSATEICGSDTDSKKCYKNQALVTAGSVNGFTMKKLTSKSSGELLEDEVSEYARNLEQQIQNAGGSTEKSGFWQNGGGRAVIDVASAGVLASVAGVATSEVIKSKNTEKFTAAQKEWMEQIGDKIHCYIGSEEAGSYGDMVQITLE